MLLINSKASIGGERVKAVMLSIRPKYVEKILKGEKTYEVRKTRLPLNTPIYVYVTNGDSLYEYEGKYGFLGGKSNNVISSYPTTLLNRKVVAKIEFDRVIVHHIEDCFVKEDCEQTLRETCLSVQDIKNYLKYNGEDIRENYQKWLFYSHHISKVKIIEPKEIGEFLVKVKQTDIENGHYTFVDMNNHFYKPLTKAPQSYCYVEVEE
jgi:hypothetical protein